MQDQHRRLPSELTRRFGLTETPRKSLPAHVTLKDWFESRDDRALERALAGWAATHERGPLRVGGVEDFARDVLFLHVALSPAARRALDGLFLTLRALSWMSWHGRDADGLRPHVTVAEECGARFDEARAFVAGHARALDAWLDNAAIFRDDGDGSGATRPVLVGRAALR